MDIRKKLKQVPSSPGIYIMKGTKDRVIYVGKAKNLRNRLKSYFQASSSLDARKSKMVKEIRDFDCVVTKNEIEALALEANFIKKSGKLQRMAHFISAPMFPQTLCGKC